MRVKLEVTPAAVQSVHELKIMALITNDSTKPVRLNETFLAMPSIVLSVWDRTGARVALTPPPVPPLDGDQDWGELAPNQSLTFIYSGSEVFGTELMSGTYSMQFVFSLIGSQSDSRLSDLLQSDQVHFTVVK